MPNVICPECGHKHYAKKNTVYHRCKECGTLWPGVGQKKASAAMQKNLKENLTGEGKGRNTENLVPGGGRELNGKGHLTHAMPPDVPRKKPGPKGPRKPKDAAEAPEPERREPATKKHWWDIEL